MQPIPGGAAARPFVTHHNALDMQLYLRIAPELYLKRLVVGGFEKVFEINRNFRNEGMSTRHNPEFTMLEFYCAYMEVNGMMDFIERLIRETAQATGQTKVTYQGKELDFAKPYARLTITDAIRKVHDFLTVGAPAPLQEAGAAALSLPPAYYQELAARYLARRDHLMPILERAGFRCYRPRGAYYVMTDISSFGFPNDRAFAQHLVQQIGVACVPGSSFYNDPRDGATQVRFAFCKRPETIDAAAEHLRKLPSLPLRKTRHMSL